MSVVSLSESRKTDLANYRYAFVVPRFGDDIAGGAETLVGTLASHLSKRGNRIQILSTCARDNRTWANEFPEGDAIAHGLPVKRFPVDERDLDTWVPKQIAVCEGLSLGVDDQIEWMRQSVNSNALYAYIASQKDNFDAFFFAPYLFGTTVWGSRIIPEKSFLIPCLHDESYAYTDIVRSVLRGVRGFVFNAKPEQEFTERLIGKVEGGEVGMGFEPVPEEDISKLQPYFNENFPYILYLGRKETGKNAQILVDHFISLKENCPDLSPLKLVVAGGGDFSDLGRSDALDRDDIVDIGFVSETEKRQLIRHSLYLCQPSTNESFSIVIMEAWLVGTPVVVHSECDVTRYHVAESGGGLYFRDLSDFIGVTERLFNNKDLSQKLADSGKQYVLSKYSWDSVVNRFDDVMRTFFDPAV